MKDTRPYSDYSPTREVGLGDIPTTWSLRRFSAYVDEVDERLGMDVPRPLLSVSQSKGVVPRDTITDKLPSASEFTKYKICQAGDLVLNRFNAYRGSLGVARETGMVSPDYLVYRPKVGVVSKFLEFLLRSNYLSNQMTLSMGGIGASDPDSSGFSRISQHHLERVLVPFLSSTDQSSIAEYLTQEAAELDSSIADYEEFINILFERKKSLIDTVVSETPGTRTPLRYIYRQSKESNAPQAEVLSVYREYGVIPKSSRSDNFNVTPQDLSKYLFVRPGYLVVNKMKAWQGSLAVSQLEGIVSPDYEVLAPIRNDLNNRFVHYMVRAPRMTSEYALRSVGIRPSQWRLYWDQLGKMQIPIPDANEQARMVKKLDNQLLEIEKAVEEARAAMALSQERRAALISAAVTGKIDVRNWKRSIERAVKSHGTA